MSVPTIQVFDIFKYGSQEANAGKLVILHYNLQGSILMSNELVYFDTIETLFNFLRDKVRIEKYLYDDKEVAISHRHISPDTLHQTSKDTFVFFIRDQYNYIKERILSL